MSQKVVAMLVNAKATLDVLLPRLDADKVYMDNPLLVSPEARAKLDEMYLALASIRSKYNLDSTNTHVCSGAIPLSWTQWTINSNHQPGCCGDCCLSYTVPGAQKRAADAACSVSAPPTTTRPAVPTSTIVPNQASYPTATAAPPSTVFCYSQFQDTAAGTIDPYISFNGTEATGAINALCNAGHTLRGGNTLGYIEAFDSPLGNGHTREIYAKVSWATSQAKCAKQASLKVSGTACVAALTAIPLHCKSSSPMRERMPLVDMV